MRKISLFCEDNGHEFTLRTLLERYASEYGVGTDIKTLSATGGVTTVHYEFSRYLNDVALGRIPMPDLILVAIDSNCVGYATRRQQLEKQVEKYPILENSVAYAIPEPHIERWLLADPVAFKTVLGKGCTCPKLKCAKDEYKKLLDSAVRAAGIRPLLGGLEFAEDIIRVADLPRIEQNEPSFERTTGQLKAFFLQWKMQTRDAK